MKFVDPGPSWTPVRVRYRDAPSIRRPTVMW